MVRIPLDLEATRKFARGLYGETKNANDVPYADHVSDIAEIVKRSYIRFHREMVSRSSNEVEWRDVFLPPPISEHGDWLEHASWLLPSIYRFGRTFEEICNETNPNVAFLVGGATRDGRLDVAMRSNAFRGHISQAGPNVQILVFGEIMVSVKELEVWTAQAFAKKRPEATHEELLVAAGYVTEEVLRMRGELEALVRIRQTTLRRWCRDADAKLSQLMLDVAKIMTAYNLKKNITKSKADPCPKTKSKRLPKI